MTTTETTDSASPTPQATVFSYAKEEPKRNKGVQFLCRSDIIVSAVQVVKQGGETNLHSHRLLDGVWFVLKGRARFYTVDNELVADLGPHEGILVPRGYPYWFERGEGPDDLEILQVEASAKPLHSVQEIIDDRIDYAPRNASLSIEDASAEWSATATP
jgi:mannose-6-phosphate isomerase-like protein (cupin superfamily)